MVWQQNNEKGATAWPLMKARYLAVGTDATLDAPSANLLQVVGAVSRAALEEELVDGHLFGVLADFAHRLVADHEHEPRGRLLLPGRPIRQSITRRKLILQVSRRNNLSS